MKKRKEKQFDIRKVRGIVMVFVGIAMIFAAVRLYAQNTRENLQAAEAADQAITQLEQIPVVTPSSESAAAESAPTIHQEEEYPTLATTSAETTPPDLPEKIIDGNRYIGYLEIPSLSRKLPVIALEYLEQLQIAPCLQAGSPYSNDAVIAAHNYEAHFGPLRDFKGGEHILFTDMNGTVIEYTVIEVKTIDPYAVDEVMDSEHDLILYTCTTGGANRVMLACDRIH